MIWRGRRGGDALEHGHSPAEIADRLAQGPRASYLRDWVYGGIDGAVTTFAVVAGVEGADLSPTIILILGGANLLADGFSMAAGSYSATKTDLDRAVHIAEMEAQHIRLDPAGEREEVRQIFAGKGFEGDDLERAVEIITASRRRWIDTMMAEEYGISPDGRRPMVAALSTFAAFFVCGTVPLLPFLFGAEQGLALASVATGLVFFLIGSLKSRWSVAAWWRSGLETLAIGMAAAALAYVVGFALKSLIA
jgi:VIT1/CCC1 family predicted Fe2+/Mn2+ transporter